MAQRYRSKKNPDYVVNAFEVGTGFMPNWLAETIGLESCVMRNQHGHCCELAFHRDGSKKVVRRGGVVYKHLLDDKIQALPGTMFREKFEPLEEEPEHKNYTAIRLRKLARSDIHAWIDGTDVLSLAEEAADEIDRLVALIWTMSRHQTQLEDKNWAADKKIARLEEIVKDETKRADSAEIELGKTNWYNRRIQPKNYSVNEAMAWVYKKMQEEKTLGAEVSEKKS